MWKYPSIFFIGLIAFFFVMRPICRAEDDAFAIYSDITDKFQKEKSEKNQDGMDIVNSISPNFTGSWSSNSPYIAEAKIVDQESELKGIVKVPNGSDKDLYHAAGLYYQGTVVLSHFSNSGSQLFIGTLSGTTISGDLSLYGPGNQFLGKLTGIVLTKDVSSNNLVANTNLTGKWKAAVLSKSASGDISSTVISAVGESVAFVSGVANVNNGSAVSPYHFRGYLLNSGEIFLWNSNGLDVRTLLGSYDGGLMSGLLEQDAVTVASSVTISRAELPLPAIMLLENQ